MASESVLPQGAIKRKTLQNEHQKCLAGTTQWVPQTMTIIVIHYTGWPKKISIKGKGQNLGVTGVSHWMWWTETSSQGEAKQGSIHRPSTRLLTPKPFLAEVLGRGNGVEETVHTTEPWHPENICEGKKKQHCPCPVMRRKWQPLGEKESWAQPRKLEYMGPYPGRL